MHQVTEEKEFHPEECSEPVVLVQETVKKPGADKRMSFRSFLRPVQTSTSGTMEAELHS